MANPGGPSALPGFVCVLPCTKLPVMYLDLFDGCRKKLHVTPEEAMNLLVSLYDRMAAAITALEDESPLEGVTATPDSCTDCKEPTVPRHNSPGIYMENCDHHFNYGCIPTRSATRKCPQCGVVSSRVLLWPGHLPTAAAKNEIFQLQKCSLGLDVSPRTMFQVDNCSVALDSPAFRLTVNLKTLYVSKRPPQNRGYGFGFGSGPKRYLTRADLLVQSNESRARKRLLGQYRCPLQCTQVRGCPFAHSNNGNHLRDFPSFFCLVHSLNGPSRSRCRVRLPENYLALTRCSAGFHPTLDDLKNVDGFACKMAEQIMAKVVVPEESTFVCAFCHKPQAEEPNPVCIHLQNCRHWVHVQCLPQARLDPNLTNPDRRLELKCPTCNIPSVRMLVWPGPFRTYLLKRTIFARQLSEFWLAVKATTQLAIVEVANKPNTFTIDYGGPCVVTFDAATAKHNSTIYYD